MGFAGFAGQLVVGPGVALADWVGGPSPVGMWAERDPGFGPIKPH